MLSQRFPKAITRATLFPEKYPKALMRASPETITSASSDLRLSGSCSDSPLSLRAVAEGNKTLLPSIAF